MDIRKQKGFGILSLLSCLEVLYLLDKVIYFIGALVLNFYTSLLPSRAFVKVISSVYSKSPPIGIP